MHEKTTETLARRLDRVERERSYNRGISKKKRMLWLAVIVMVWASMLFPRALALGADGNLWRELSGDYRMLYVAGVVDAYHAIRTGGKDLTEKTGYKMSLLEEDLAAISTCIQRMNTEQLTAIVENYMNANPSQWHYSMAGIIWAALQDVCKE